MVKMTTSDDKYPGSQGNLGLTKKSITFYNLACPSEIVVDIIVLNLFHTALELQTVIFSYV